MFQLARQNQRHNDVARARSVDRTIDRSPAMEPGKRAITDGLNAAYNGTPDYYTRAVDSAIRELDAIRTTALPSYVAIRRKQNVNAMTKQIELTKSAMQVRHMILCANNHVYALEKAATHKDPMVLWLRARMDRVVAQAMKLGCYADAMDMIPQRFIDDTKQKNAAKKTQNVNVKITHQPPPVTQTTLSSTAAAQVRKPANTARPAQRTARGTGPVTTLGRPPWAASTSAVPTDQRAHANIRPGFRPTRV